MGDYSFYYAILICVWAAIWGAEFYYFRSRRAHGWLFRRMSPSKWLAFGSVCAAVPTLYLLSYAPLMRLGLGPLDDLFVPVQWLIDHTPLREPLIAWASFWNVPVETLEVASNLRMRGSFWGTVPAPIYASGWIAIGIICCVAPPFLLESGLQIVRTKFRRRPSEPLAI